MNYRNLVLEEEDGVLTVTVSRPSVHNALSQIMLTELYHLFSGLTQPAVLTAAEGPAFVAGADIRDMAIMGPAEGAEFGRLGQAVMNAVENAPVPVIACVDGYALGGGCELAMAADFIYATTKAVFGQPEVLLGLIPGFGGCVRLPRLVGAGVARELVYTGRKIDAVEAHQIGLVNKVFDNREEMLVAARTTLGTIMNNSPRAVASAKAVINSVRGKEIRHGLEDELEAFRQAFTTDDMRGGTQAFLAKRAPQFRWGER